MAGFKRGQYVLIRDYPFGNALKVGGEIVGILPNDHYNVLMTSGANEGKIIMYRHWKLFVDTQAKIE